MSRLLVLLAVLFCSASVHAATIDFTGPYAPPNWTRLVSGDGSITMTSTAATLTSPTNLGNGGVVDLTITTVDSGRVTFDWYYTTVDDPFFERFGYLLNGLFTQLTNNGGSGAQNGTAMVLISNGDVFGFREWALDNLGGSSSTRISNFSVPEPSSLFIAAIGLLGLAGIRRRFG
jgi:hypothetical protein